MPPILEHKRRALSALADEGTQIIHPRPLHNAELLFFTIHRQNDGALFLSLADNLRLQISIFPMSAANELVGVVDDDRSIRRGLQRLLNSAGYAAEMFASAEEYLARETFEGPICLVLDLRMPGLHGLDLQRVLEARGGCEQIVFITGHGDVLTCTKAMKNGAIDFLTKPFDDTELIEAIERSLARGREIRQKRMERRTAQSKIEKLTPREFEVLRFVIMGLLNKQIAGELNTAEKTIKVHRGRVMQKLGLTSVPDLVRLSQSAGVSPARSEEESGGFVTIRPRSHSQIHAAV